MTTPSRPSIRAVPELKHPQIASDGPLFHVACATGQLDGAPRGAWIANDLIPRNPVLKEFEEAGIRYSFVALDPLRDAQPGSFARLIDQVTSRSVPGQSVYGNDAPVHLYAEVRREATAVKQRLELVCASGLHSAETAALVREILTSGYDLACDFINILRTRFGQYWLRPRVDLTSWVSATYWSADARCWYVLDAPEGFEIKRLQSNAAATEGLSKPGLIVQQVITQADLASIAASRTVTEPSFASDMISRALVDIGEGRLRSAVIHAMIAVESAVKKRLDALANQRLPGLFGPNLLERIAEEVSTLTLARVVFSQLCASTPAPPVDWELLDELHQTRNQFVHLGRRRLPELERGRSQILEAGRFIGFLEGTSGDAS